MKRTLITLIVTIVATAGLVGITSAPEAQAEEAAAKVKEVPLKAKDGKIEFVGAKVTGDHDGGFKQWNGVAVVNASGELQKLSFEVDTTSVWTDNDRLTGHLKSPDFFDVAKYPKSTFQSAKIEEAKTDGATHRIVGTMNLHGVIKKIAFPATIKRDGDTITASAEFVINRFDWGITYKGMADDLIKKEVLLKINFAIPAKG